MFIFRINKKIFLFCICFILESCANNEYKRPNLDFSDKDKKYNLNNFIIEQVEDANLKEILKVAISENFTIKKNRYKIEKYYARLDIARDALLPSINVGTKSTYNEISKQGLQGINPFMYQNYKSFSAATSLEWQIDIFGRIKKQKEEIFSLLQAQELDNEDLINKIVLKLINEYSLSCTLINQKKIIIEKLELYKKLSDIYKSRHLAGVGDLFSYNNSLVIIDNVLLELSEIDQQINEVFYRIDILQGRNIGSSRLVLEPKIKDIPQFKNIIEKPVKSEVIESNRKILAAEKEAMAANSRVRITFSEYFPRFTFNANVGIESINSKNIFSKNAKYFNSGIGFSWRIFDFSKINNEIKEAKAEEKEFLESYKRIVQEVLSSIEIASLKIKKTKESTKILQRNFDIKMSSYKIQKSYYDAGLKDYIDVVSAKSEMLDSQVKLLNSQNEFVASISEYLASIY